MLGTLASIFIDAENGRVSLPRAKAGSVAVKYAMGGQICELRTTKKRTIEATLNGARVGLDELPLPSKVIAVSTTALDKFPLLRRTFDDEIDQKEPVYTYLGLRDYTGRASATAVVYRALEALVDASEASSERRTRISRVFDFLGYLPVVEHTYRWRYVSIWRGEETLLDLLNSDDGRMAYRSMTARLRRLVSREPAALGQLYDAVETARTATESNRELRQSADFGGDKSTDRSMFDHLGLLRRAGLIELRSVELQTISGATVDLREVSSGELSLATALLGIAATIQDDALVIIDEPEVSLHPEWQSQYLELLTSIFSEFVGCHFVVATHSPMIVADVPSDSATVVSLSSSNADTKPGSNFAGDSVDEVLVRAFNVTGRNNLFVKQELVEALRLAANGEASSLRFAEIIAHLSSLSLGLDSDSPTRMLIEQLKQTLETAGA